MFKREHMGTGPSPLHDTANRSKRVRKGSSDVGAQKRTVRWIKNLVLDLSPPPAEFEDARISDAHYSSEELQEFRREFRELYEAAVARAQNVTTDCNLHTSIPPSLSCLDEQASSCSSDSNKVCARGTAAHGRL